MTLVIADIVIKSINTYFWQNALLNNPEHMKPVSTASIKPADKAVLNRTLARILFAKLTIIEIQKIKKPGTERTNEIKTTVLISPAHSDGWRSAMERKNPDNTPFTNDASNHTVKVITLF